ncbi:MAG: helix-turn-helix domain-containing protein [Deltaproteobacteria bacterium]|nr:helix-turn-helix domain-containing protein [Deltaproteobacteria bacterium]
MGEDSYAGIQGDCNIGSASLDIPREYLQGLLVVVAYKWNNGVGHRKKGILPLDACWLNLRQYNGVNEKDWLFERVLITLLLPFLAMGRSLFCISRYMRGLLAHPSLILHILSIFSIIYCDDSQLLKEKGPQALKRRFRQNHHHKNRTDKEIEDVVIAFSLENPHLGQVQVSAQLRTNYQIELSPNGVRYVWLRENMNTSALRVQRSKSSLSAA